MASHALRNGPIVQPELYPRPAVWVHARSSGERPSAFGTHSLLRRGLNARGGGREDAHLRVDGPHDLADLRQLPAKRAAPTRQTPPPSRTVFSVPMREARSPAIRLPKGAMPRKATVYKLITRPRFCSCTIVCRIVLLAANCTMIEKPATQRMAIESRRSVE